ncbi:MAG: hypothetical protein EBS05_06905 [Proteobacteria bacterium]|nr:hypothetical protein [Pseudomonadota bacterium]
MDFVGIVMFAIFLYVRPQDFVGFLDSFRPAFLSLAIAGVGIFIRPGGVTWKQVIRTPQDWMVTIYFLYILLFTPGSFGDLWGQIYQYVGFYFLVVIALSNFQRIYQYLGWWLGCIMFIAVMALLSLIGIDPLDSATTTAGSLGRLTLNTSLFSNPNGLGHSVMVAVPLIYFFMFWNRPVFIKEVGAAMIFFPLLCTYFTQSKGAFLSGFGAIVATLAFGRPKWVQVLIVSGALSFGFGGLQLLPRFGEVQLGGQGGRKDEAVAGRLYAFEFGKWAFENTPYGVGYGNFYAAFLRKEGDIKARASHSSFNQVQAEFGYWGLLIFTGILYSCFHSLARAKTADDNEERVRRMLFCMVIAYFVSSWMIDFGFRAAFFVMVAMVSAFHRILMDRTPTYSAPVAGEAGESWGGIIGLGSAQLSVAGGGMALAPVNARDYLAERKVVRGAPSRPRQALSAQTGVKRAEQQHVPVGFVSPIKDAGEVPGVASPYMPWPHFRWYDAVGIYLSLQLVLQIRDYVITNL